MSDVTPGGDQKVAAGAVQPPEGASTLEVVEVKRGMFGAGGSGDTSGYGGLITPIAMPAASARPYGSWFDQVVDVLTEVLTEAGVQRGGAAGGADHRRRPRVPRRRLPGAARRPGPAVRAVARRERRALPA
jgi:hypothetical protein